MTACATSLRDRFRPIRQGHPNSQRNVTGAISLGLINNPGTALDHLIMIR